MMMDKEAVRFHNLVFQDKLKQKQEPYPATIQGVEVIVNPEVFPGATDTKLLAVHINVKPNERFLDITTGSGIFAVIAGLQGASGVAVDINPKAVECARENFERHGLGHHVQAVESDMFNSLEGQQFDWIFANGPYFEGEVKEPLEHAFYGVSEFNKRLFSEAHFYLKNQGKMLVTFPEWGYVGEFERLIMENNWVFRIIDKKASDDNERIYRLYEVEKNKIN